MSNWELYGTMDHSQKILKNLSFSKSILQPLRSSCESVHVDFIFDDFMLNYQAMLDSSWWMALRILLDFMRSRFLTFSAILLPISMASAVKCSILALRVRPRSVVSTQQASKIPNSSPKRFSSGSSSTLPSRRLKFSPLSPSSCPNPSCSRCTCSRNSDSTPVRKRLLKESRSLVTSSKKATMQFCWGREASESAGRTLGGKDFFLGRKGVRAGWRLLSSAIFFLRKLFSRLSCSISMRQQRSQSISSSESEKLCAELVRMESRRVRCGASEMVEWSPWVLYINNKIPQSVLLFRCLKYFTSPFHFDCVIHRQDIFKEE